MRAAVGAQINIDHPNTTLENLFGGVMKVLLRDVFDISISENVNIFFPWVACFRGFISFSVSRYIVQQLSLLIFQSITVKVSSYMSFVTYRYIC